MKAIILAAGVGKRLRSITTGPKCLIEINNEPLIIRNIKVLNGFGIKEISIVVGYKADEIMNAVKKAGLKVRFVKNDDFTEGSILSLWAARTALRGDVLLMDADVYFEKALIKRALKPRKDSFFLIDSGAKNDSEAVRVGFVGRRAQALARGLDGNYSVLGEWIGLLKLSSYGSKSLMELLKEKISSGERDAGYEFIIPELFDKMTISYELIDGLKWIEIDFPKDVRKAKGMKLD